MERSGLVKKIQWSGAIPLPDKKKEVRKMIITKKCVCGNEITYTILPNGAWFSVSGVEWGGLVEYCARCGRHPTHCNRCGRDVFVERIDIEPLCSLCLKKEKKCKKINKEG